MALKEEVVSGVKKRCTDKSGKGHRQQLGQKVGKSLRSMKRDVRDNEFEDQKHEHDAEGERDVVKSGGSRRGRLSKQWGFTQIWGHRGKVILSL